VNYTVELSRTAKKQLFELNKSMRRRVDKKLLGLASDPYGDTVKLKYQPGFRQRVGDYRITYQVNDNQRVVLVTGILHRREAYR
jgi:mRNA interferase RelE/StbE